MPRIIIRGKENSQNPTYTKSTKGKSMFSFRKGINLHNIKINCQKIPFHKHAHALKNKNKKRDRTFALI